MYTYSYLTFTSIQTQHNMDQIGSAVIQLIYLWTMLLLWLNSTALWFDGAFGRLFAGGIFLAGLSDLMPFLHLHVRAVEK